MRTFNTNKHGQFVEHICSIPQDLILLSLRSGTAILGANVKDDKQLVIRVFEPHSGEEVARTFEVFGHGDSFTPLSTQTDSSDRHMPDVVREYICPAGDKHFLFERIGR